MHVSYTMFLALPLVSKYPRCSTVFADQVLYVKVLHRLCRATAILHISLDLKLLRLIYKLYTQVVFSLDIVAAQQVSARCRERARWITCPQLHNEVPPHTKRDPDTGSHRQRLRTGNSSINSSLIGSSSKPVSLNHLIPGLSFLQHCSQSRNSLPQSKTRHLLRVIRAGPLV